MIVTLDGSAVGETLADRRNHARWTDLRNSGDRLADQLFVALQFAI